MILGGGQSLAGVGAADAWSDGAGTFTIAVCDEELWQGGTVDLFLLRREAALAFFDPEARLFGTAFASYGAADGDCEDGSIVCDAGGWEVCVSALCAACDGETVPDKNGNNIKIAARVIQESRATVK